MNTIKLSWKFYKKWLPKGLLVLLMGILAITCSLMLPQITRLVVDFVFIGDASALSSLTGIWAKLLNGNFGALGSWELLLWLCGIFLAFVVLRNLIIYFRNVFWHSYSQAYGREIRSYGFDYYMNRLQPPSSFNEAFVLLTHDVTSFRNLFVFYLHYIIENAIFIGISIFFVFGIHPTLGLYLLSVLPFAILIAVVFMKKSSVILKNSRQQYSLLSATAQESLDASRNLKTFMANDHIKNRFGQANQTYFDAKKREVNITSSYILWLDIFKAVAYASMLIVGIIFATNGEISTGAYVSFAAYSLTMLLEIIKMLRNSLDFQIYFISANRFAQFITQKEKSSSHKAKALVSRPPSIIIEDLSVEFYNKPVLQKLTLEIPYGKHVAIVGYQGGGKSVLGQALLKLQNIESGAILVDNTDIREIATDELRNQFSYVPQEPFLFSDTIKENIKLFHPEGDEEQMKQAIQAVELSRWLGKLRNGLNYIIPENAIGVPNQERQLISFARALYKNAPILLLDSPFAVFDEAQASVLRKSVLEWYQGKTVILLTSHPLDALDCEMIFFLDKGKIIEKGTPQALIEKNGKFAEFMRKTAPDDEE